MGPKRKRTTSPALRKRKTTSRTVEMNTDASISHGQQGLQGPAILPAPNSLVGPNDFPPLPMVQVQVPGFGASPHASGSREPGNVASSNNTCNLGSVIEVPPISVTSLFDAIGDHVPLKLKEKIWEGQFVDLSILIKSARDLERELESGGEVVMRDGKLVIQKHTANKPLYNIHSWTSAFLIYISISLERHPGKAQELLKYMRDIRLAASRAPMPNCWVRYDEQFRLKRASNPASSWGVIDSELWLLCLSHSQSQNDHFDQKQVSSEQNVNSTTPAHAFRPPKVCRYFNQGNCRFPNCKFKHVCSKCAAPHPATNCKRQ